AEDGIRDFHVTGVQTCALPISDAAARARLLCCYRWRRDCRIQSNGLGPPWQPSSGACWPVPGPWPILARLRDGTPTAPGRADSRSEERRVGKECGERWGSDGDE